MQAWETGTDFRALLESDPEMVLDVEAALDEAFDLDRSLRHLGPVSAAALDAHRWLDQDPRVMPARLSTAACTPTSRHDA